MRKKKLLLSFLFLLASTFEIFAQTSTQRLVVWQKNGEKIRFDLTEEPVTTFDDGKLVIKTNLTTSTFQLENILRYTYEGEMTPINAPLIQDGEIRYSQGDNLMRFDGLSDGTSVTLYSADGVQLSVQYAQKGQPSIVSLANYPTGVYIVKVKDVTYKFMKR